MVKLINILLLLISIISIFSSLSIAEELLTPDDLIRLSFTDLMNIKIFTASKKEEKVSDIPASVVIVTRKDIEKYGYQSLEDISQNIPGLYMVNSGELATKPFGVRGFWSGGSRNFLILINGVKQLFDLTSASDVSNISLPVESIDRIEVVRGPMAVIYGTGSFFGIINIFTNKIPEESQSSSLLSVTYGSEKTSRGTARIVGSDGNFEYIFTGAYSYSYGPDESVGKMVSNLGLLDTLYNINKQKGNNRTGGRMESENKYFDFSGKYKNFHLNFSYSENIHEPYWFVPPVDEGTRIITRFTKITPGYKKKLTNKLTLDGKFTYTNTFYQSLWDQYVKDFYATQITTVSSWDGELNLFYTPSFQLEISSGIQTYLITKQFDHSDFPYYKIDNMSWSKDEDDVISTYALFSQINYQPVKKIRLVAGIRLDKAFKYGVNSSIYKGILDTTHLDDLPIVYTVREYTYDDEDIEIIPRLGTIYSLNDNNIFKLLYGKAITRPSLWQNINQAGSPKILKTEYIQTFELNYIGSFSDKMMLNTSIFHNIIDNLITRIDGFDEDNNYYVSFSNAGKMITDGVEITVKTSPFDNFLLEVSGVYQQTKNERKNLKDVEVGYSPEFLGYLKASYNFSEKLALGVAAHYVDKMETYFDDLPEDPANPQEGQKGRIGLSVKGYFNIDTNLRFKEVYKDIYINVRCSNILNEDILYPVTAGSNNFVWADKGLIGHGRRIFVTLGVEF